MSNPDKSPSTHDRSQPNWQQCIVYNKYNLIMSTYYNILRQPASLQCFYHVIITNVLTLPKKKKKYHISELYVCSDIQMSDCITSNLHITITNNSHLFFQPLSVHSKKRLQLDYPVLDLMTNNDEKIPLPCICSDVR